MSRFADFRFGKVPEEYFAPTEGGGLSHFLYLVTDCEHPDRQVAKGITVYTPAGYDPAGQYNVLYLMHGAGDNETAWLGTPDAPSPFKHILDHMIADGRLAPLIVAAPTVRMGERNYDGTMFEFYREFVSAVMPAVESRYATYAENTTPAGLAASRAHRGIGGFSLGSSMTWNGFARNLAYLSWFLPMCGDCWELGKMSGSLRTEETAKLLSDAAVNGGSPEFRIFAAVGTKDIAYPNLRPQVEAMWQQPAFTKASRSFEEGNLAYCEVEGYDHEYLRCYEYAFNALPHFFR